MEAQTCKNKKFNTRKEKIDNRLKAAIMIEEITTLMKYEVSKTYLFPPLSSLRSTINTLNHGKTMRLM
jgi:hypothetical protein